MLAGAAAQLAGSLLLYKLMAPAQYGLYALFITFLSVVFSFGLLGAEQTFMRTCSIKDGRITINKNLVILLFICFLMGPAVLVLISSLVFMQAFSFIELYLVAIAAVMVMFGYNYQRISGRFVESQLINNFWRLCILFSLLAGILIGFEFKTVAVWIVVGLIISSSFFLYRFFQEKNIEIVRSGSDAFFIVKLSLSFLFSMGVLTALSFFDRYLIGAKFDIEIFGNFFFLQNVFVHPFVLISNYIGFKGLVEYKKYFNVKEFNKKIIFLLVLMPIVSAAYVAIIFYFDQVINLYFGFYSFFDLIIPLVVFGCIKLVYSYLSAAMGARGHAKNIFISNVVSGIFAFFMGVFLINVNVNIETVAWSMVILWLIRCTAYYIGIRRSVVK
ncbi:hypothetical protein BGP75_24925 [Motiliproteus sp. MSK22-1]|nr:hypothetical protein BGP75_24925 [Motiliproteus sp. MSK22-1]